MSVRTLVPEAVPGADISCPVNTDLSAKQYRFVKDNAGAVVIAGAGDAAEGILQDAPLGTATKTLLGTVRTFGLSKVVLGADVLAGAFLKSDATGAAVTAAGGDLYNAYSLTAGVSGESLAVLIAHGKA